MKLLNSFKKSLTSLMNTPTSPNSFDPSLISLIDKAHFTKRTKRHYSLKLESNTPESSPRHSSDDDNKAMKTPVENNMKTFEMIKKMRVARNAPVDLLGSHLQFNKEDPKDTQGFQLITSLMMSAQTKDQTTDLVMKRLLSKGLSVDFIDKLELPELKNLIYEVNFNNNKAKYLKNLAEILKKNYNGKMPDKYEEILKLPGIGPKMGILYMYFHLNQIVGISVDTHVHRISNRLGWVDTKVPEGTRKCLEKIFDKSIWKEINEILVGFGQTVCLPVNPKCQECLLNNICPEGIKNLGGLRTKSKKTKKK